MLKNLHLSLRAKRSKLNVSPSPYPSPVKGEGKDLVCDNILSLTHSDSPAHSELVEELDCHVPIASELAMTINTQGETVCKK